MKPFPHLLIFTSLGCSPITFALVQKPGLQLPITAAASKSQVIQLFTEAYDAYTKFAFGHDDLSPISQSFSDNRNGWGATIVDAMSTMKIMGLEDQFQKAVNFSSQIDFSGLLSAYELNGNQPQVLVTKAQQLADKLLFGFTGSSPIPFNEVNFATNKVDTSTSNIAQAGTLTMEWTILSKLTGNSTYRTLAENAVKHIAQLKAPLPGLPAQGIDPQSGKFSGAYVTWGGGSDSYFEYLLKYPRLDPTVDEIYLQAWKAAIDSSMNFLLKTSTIGGWTYLADFGDDRKIHPVGSHLACFHGGNWILGGQLLQNQTLVDIGLKLTDACWNTYANTATGIGPETFAYTTQVKNQLPQGSDDGTFTGNTMTLDQTTFNNQHGFYITNGQYLLRPEVLESNFYAWRVSGDPKYVANAQVALKSFQNHLPVPNGVGGVGGLFDVNNIQSGHFDDAESFFYAEVMKYLYLTFDDPSHISLDDWVFNTEAHPFRAPALGGKLVTTGQPISEGTVTATSLAKRLEPRLAACVSLLLVVLVIL